MEKKNIKENILDKIEKEKISPKSRWRFFANHVLLWVPAVLAILLGAAAVSAILFDLTNAGWEFYEKTHPSFGNFIFEVVPYLWIAISILFGFLAIKQIRNTYGGYKYNISVIVLSSILLSLIIGAVAYTQGVGAIVDRNVGKSLPFHTPVEQRQFQTWMDTGNGKIAGNIERRSVESITLKTFSGEVWEINISDISEIGKVAIEKENQIRVIGYEVPEKEFEFYACEVFPWKLRGLPTRPSHENMEDFKRNLQNERNPDMLRIKRCSYEGLLKN